MGLHRASIAPALRELEVLGIIEITTHGRGGNAEYRMSNQFRLTYEHTASGNPTHEWKRFAGHVDTKVDAQTMAEADQVARMARKDQDDTAVDRGKKLARKKQKTDAGFCKGPMPESDTENEKLPMPDSGTTGVVQKPALPLISRGGGGSPPPPDLESATMPDLLAVANVGEREKEAAAAEPPNEPSLAALMCALKSASQGSPEQFRAVDKLVDDNPPETANECLKRMLDSYPREPAILRAHFAFAISRQR
jgi:hypothetical protein